MARNCAVLWANTWTWLEFEEFNRIEHGEMDMRRGSYLHDMFPLSPLGEMSVYLHVEFLVKQILHTSFLS